jgi:galactokinase/mevalonate kinase-like predicted kinase
MNFAAKPPRHNTAHEWVDYLRDSEGLGGILAKTEDIAKLKVSLKSALAVLDLENLAQKIELSWRSESKNELILLVSNASIASRLQQILTSLIN